MRGKERKIAKWLIVSSVITAVLILAILQSKNFIIGPKVEIIRPTHKEEISQALVKIIGRAKNVSEIKLNGRNIFVDEAGKFEEEILLADGYNKIVVEAKDRFNRKATEELQLVLK